VSALALALLLAVVPALLHGLRGEPAAATAASSAGATGASGQTGSTGTFPNPSTVPAPDLGAPAQTRQWPVVRWRSSRAVGRPYAGRLVRGVQLPTEGEHFFTWDPILKRPPNRGWRRWGTDKLVRTLLAVVADYRLANPGAPRVGVADLSRPRGGEFGPRYGGLGHRSHQNGLDVDVYYPRLDRRERRPKRPRQIDFVLAQDLVNRFVEAGAVYVFVGPRTHLHGPRKVVQPLVYHDDHLHVRISAR
jgi:murein endopeptidase